MANDQGRTELLHPTAYMELGESWEAETVPAKPSDENTVTAKSEWDFPGAPEPPPEAQLSGTAHKALLF